ncbi:hypothetical protein PHISCL_06918 [Aspergillus sclerotialis]|uniref:Uncharacterized protein n=1 Tax=Aspergillus sclerotialis TaxID=2070753 RepID=A0A3A2ZC56_9EURO|nr:hypothetical protein PHISCL_06918 [Aspergillus sclerotialis]
MEPQGSLETHYAFLKGLPEGTPQFPYISNDDIYGKTKSLEQNLEADENISPFLVFLDVPKETFDEATTSEKSPIKHCRFTYARHLQCLILEVLSKAHEAAREGMISLFDSKISEMGLYSTLERPGPVTRTYGQVSKQPDAQWLPHAPNEDPSKPTVFLEVGYSETLGRLENDAKRWLTCPRSPLMMVLLVKVYEYPKIVTQILAGLRKQQWTMAGNNSAATITRSDGTNYVDGALVMPFEFIFWREKDKENPKEKDVVLKGRDLEAFAESVWRTQGLI